MVVKIVFSLVVVIVVLNMGLVVHASAVRTILAGRITENNDEKESIKTIAIVTINSCFVILVVIIAKIRLLEREKKLAKFLR